MWYGPKKNEFKFDLDRFTFFNIVRLGIFNLFLKNN